MRTYEILRANKTDISPDIYTRLMGRCFNGGKGIEMPNPRGVLTLVNFADYNHSVKTWYDTTFGREYHFANAVLSDASCGGVAMAPPETLLDIDLSTTDFTIYIVDHFRLNDPAWTDYLVGGEGSAWDWRFGMSGWYTIMGQGYDRGGSIYTTSIGKSRGINTPYVDVIRYDHTKGEMISYNTGMLPMKLSRKPTEWHVKIYCGANTTEAYGFTPYWTFSYLLFAAAANVYHSDQEVENNVAWLKDKYGAR